VNKRGNISFFFCLGFSKMSETSAWVFEITSSIVAKEARLLELKKYANIKPLENDISIHIAGGETMSVNKMIDFLKELHELRVIEQEDS
jgi:hypothetical protein